jgi:hypothetical protein
MTNTQTAINKRNAAVFKGYDAWLTTDTQAEEAAEDQEQLEAVMEEHDCDEEEAQAIIDNGDNEVDDFEERDPDDDLDHNAECRWC